MHLALLQNRKDRNDTGSQNKLYRTGRSILKNKVTETSF